MRVIGVGLVVRLLRSSVVSGVVGARLRLHGGGFWPQHVAYSLCAAFAENLRHINSFITDFQTYTISWFKLIHEVVPFSGPSSDIRGA